MSKWAFLGLLAATAMTATPVAAQAVVRVKEADPSLILRGVKIPAGTDLFVLSGLVASPIDPARTEKVEDYGDTRRQTVSILDKIRGTLEAQGYAMRDIIKLTVFLVGDPAKAGAMDFAGMNEGFRQFFGTADNPETVARSTVQVVALTSPKYLVEIEAVAARGGRP